MKIESGLFSGIVIPESEIAFLRNDSGDATPWWAPVFRTPHFIQKFSPLDGWAVIVNAKAGEFNLPDYANTPDGSAPPVQPTQLFEAKLVKEGIVFATASSLEIIDGEKAWERGETNCRGRLYDALGLPGALKGGNANPSTGTSANKGNKGGTSTGKPPLVVVPMTAAAAQIDQVQQQPAVTLVEVQAQQHVTDSDSASETPTDHSEPESTTTEATSADVTPTTPVQSGPIQHAPGINANLLSQIERQARLVGVPVRSLSSNDDAKKFFAELLSQSNTKAAS